MITECPDCTADLQQTGDRYTCPACGHKGEQITLELPEEAEQLTLF